MTHSHRRWASLVAGLALAAVARADPVPRTIHGQNGGRDAGSVGAVPFTGRPLFVQEELRLEGRRPVKLVAFSPDGRTLLDSSGFDLSLWDVAGAGDPVEHPAWQARDLGTPRGFESAAFSPDGHTLALGCRDKSVRLFAVGGDDSLSPLSDGTEHDGSVQSLAFNAAGTVLASGGADGVIYLWSIDHGQLHRQVIIRVLHAMFGVRHLAFLPGTGRVSVVAACGDGSVRIFDLIGNGPTAVERGTYKFPSLFDLPMAASPTGGPVAFGSRQDLLLLSRNGGTVAFHGHKGNVTAVAWAPDGRALATTGEDGRLIVWDAAGRVRYETMRPKKFTGLSFDPAAPKGGPYRLAAANENGTVYLLRLGDTAVGRQPAAAAAAGPGRSGRPAGGVPPRRLTATGPGVPAMSQAPRRPGHARHARAGGPIPPAVRGRQGLAPAGSCTRSSSGRTPSSSCCWRRCSPAATACWWACRGWPRR